MIVRPLTLETAKQLAEWRNMSRESLRTGWTTIPQQEQFYQDNFRKDYQYWEFFWEGTHEVLAAGGFVHIKGTRAEIALIVAPKARKMGFGNQCAEWLLQEGFANLGYKVIWGEVYGCGATSFWDRIYSKYHAGVVRKYRRKYWDGRWWMGLKFKINRKQYYAQQERSISRSMHSGSAHRNDKHPGANT